MSFRITSQSNLFVNTPKYVLSVVLTEPMPFGVMTVRYHENQHLLEKRYVLSDVWAYAANTRGRWQETQFDLKMKKKYFQATI